MDHGISYDAIFAAFDGDDEIEKYCDPDNLNKTPIGVIDNTYEKLVEYQQYIDGVFKVIEIEGDIAGFVYYADNVLISFGVNKKYRNQETLSSIFEDIKTWLGGDFITLMWERNKRAIDWLKRCGMEQEELDMINVVKLKYKSCH